MVSAVRTLRLIENHFLSLEGVRREPNQAYYLPDAGEGLVASGVR
jgi:hypothetical protein